MNKKIEKLLAKSVALREKRDATGAQYADEAYELANQTGDTSLILAALKEKIVYALHIKSAYDEAEVLANELLERIDITVNPELAATAYNALGIRWDIGGKYFEARNYYQQTIDLLANVALLTYDAKIILGNAYYNIVKLYTQINSDAVKNDYLEKAERLFESVSYHDGLARVWNMRASMLPENAPLEERLRLFQKAYSFYPENEAAAAKTICKGNIGLCHCHLSQFKEGLPLLKEALGEFERLNNPPLVAFIHFQIAEGLRLKGDNLEAIKHLQKAENILLTAKAKVYLDVVYKEWAINLAAIGKYEEAYEKQSKFIAQANDRQEFDRESAVEEARLKFELEKKEREAELLRKQNAEIELYNQKLQQVVTELNQFAYVASHDLKEPLRMVSNYMQLLEKSLEGKLDEDQAIYIRFADEGAKRMFSLIDSLLAFARATVDTELQPIDLNLVVREVTHIVLADRQRKVNINADKLPVVMADNNQMLQVFQNLITNAIKYNDKSEVNIHIAYRLEENEHTITIQDNGIGILPRHREKVFDIFKRLHGRESYSGTGIGLAICKKIINKLHGRIWVEDGNLGGTAFVFTIPETATAV